MWLSFDFIGWNLVTLSWLLMLVAGFRYIWYTLGEGVPHIGTWLTWASLSCLTALGMWQAGSLSPMLLTAVFFDLAILALSLKRGVWGISWADRWCLYAAALGLALFLYFMDSYPQIATIVGVGVTLLGTVPTLVKSWRAPDQESVLAHGIGATSSGVQLFANNSWSIDNDLQPLGWFIMGSSLIITILWSRRRDHLALQLDELGSD